MANSHNRRTHSATTRISYLETELDTLKKRSKTSNSVDPATEARIAELETQIESNNAPAVVLQDIIADLDERYESSGGATIPAASTDVRGLVELATNAEATAGLDTSRAVTPAALQAAVSSWVAARYGYGVQTPDWDTVSRVGFYWSMGDAGNRPPLGGDNLYIGTHLSAGTYQNPTTSTEVGHVQEVYEIVPSTGVVRNVWRRAKTSGGWSAWSATVSLPVATTNSAGISELATAQETEAGTDGTRVVTPLGLKPLLDGKAPLDHTHQSSNIIDFATAVPAVMPTATTDRQGKVELATIAEALAGVDSTRAVTSEGVSAVADTLRNDITTQVSNDILAVEQKADDALNTVRSTIAAQLDEYFVTNNDVTPPPPNAGWSPNSPQRAPGEYIWRRTKYTTVAGDVSYSQPIVITGSDGTAGQDAIMLRIDSSKGVVFKNNTIGTVFTVTIFKGALRITNIDDLWANVSPTAYLEWRWRRYDDSDFGIISSSDGRISQGGFAFAVSPSDVDVKTVFECILNT